jgi:hypothetical protein
VEISLRLVMLSFWLRRMFFVDVVLVKRGLSGCHQALPWLRRPLCGLEHAVLGDFYAIWHVLAPFCRVCGPLHEAWRHWLG